MKLLVLGPGYTASAAIARLNGVAEWIAASARSKAAADALRRRGVLGFLFDAEARSSALIDRLQDTTHLLVSIPPAESGDRVLQNHLGDLENAASLGSIVYLSTIGVYGDRGGGWVDESAEPRPKNARSVARVAAETGWRKLGQGLGIPTAILRLAGIYGPGRNALSNLVRGTARRIVTERQVFNRVHVDDAAAAIVAAISARGDGVFNVVDDEPAPPQDVVTFAAALLGVAPPPVERLEEADLSPLARSFYSENKRVRNARLKSDLGVSPAYPTYREGLRSLWKAGEGRTG